MPFVVGENIGPYRILEQLGRGGMATVFRAYHAALDRYVAIKALHPAFMEDSNFLARFQREARVVAKLEHPNIVPIYDFAEHEGRPYLVMKYIEGETLKARLSQGSIGTDEMLFIAAAVGDALAYAHEKGILHRDVKPSNVLLGFDKRVYLADFGLARIAQAGESTMSSDMMLGTPQYISPEQAMGLKELDEGTDIYSFGVMLYELVTGRVPFSADTPFSIIHDHIYTPLPPPKMVNSEVPDGVERVLLKALAKERKHRYEDAAALVAAFSSAVRGDAPDVQTEKPAEEETPASASMDLTDQPSGGPIEVSNETVSEDVVPEGVEKPDELDVPSQTELESPDTVEEKPKKKRKLRWWQIVLIVIGVLFCCLIAIGIISERQNQGINLGDRATQEAAGEIEGLREQLRLAQEDVSENPEDPYAQLELGKILWDNGRHGDAAETFRVAIDLAQDDFDFLIEVADVMGERGLWVARAGLYLSLKLKFPDEFSDSYYDDQFREAVYIAAEFAEAQDSIPIPRIATVDEALERVVKARYSLFNGSLEDAQSSVDEVLTSMKPGMNEAILLQIEISLSNGDQPKARQLTTELEMKDELPEWIRLQLDFLWQNAESGNLQDVGEDAPDDPWYHLEMLTLAIDENDMEMAEKEYNMMLETAQDQPDVYFAAGNVLAEAGAWVYAAPLYITSQKMMDVPSDEVAERIQMALYYGAVDPEAPAVLLNPDLTLDDAEIKLLEARFELYNGDLAAAERMVNKVLSEDPYLPEEPLLEAELMIALDDIDGARAILESIQDNPEFPLWIQDEARNKLEEINQ